MLKILVPDHYYKNIFEIDLQKLKDDNIKGIICDIDNTIVPYEKKEVMNDVLDWFQTLKKMNFKVCLVSNGREKRVKFFRKELNLPALGQAVKPSKKAFKKALNHILKLDKSETAVIGDQIFTDVLGGNRAGLKTILVDPMGEKEFFVTKFVRFIESLVFKRDQQF